MNTDPFPDPQERFQERYVQQLVDKVVAMPEISLRNGLPGSREHWERWAKRARNATRRSLDLPDTPHSPSFRIVGETQVGTVKIQRILYESEPGSWVTASLYAPSQGMRVTGKNPQGDKSPGLVLASGHGGSKSSFFNQYAGQLYAKLGCYVLIPDTIGEEERDNDVSYGSRGHRSHFYIDRAYECGRSMLGKMVLDVMRGIDVLLALPGVDRGRIGCGGHSLGCTIAMFVTALHDSCRLSLPASWVSSYKQRGAGPSCEWRTSNLLQTVDQAELLALAAPRSATLILAGDRDYPDNGIEHVRSTYADLRKAYSLYGAEERVGLRVTEGGGHRPYFLGVEAYRWVARHFQLPVKEPLQSMRLGDWTDAHSITIEPLYASDTDYAGTRVVKDDIRLLEPGELACFETGDPARSSVTVGSWIRQVEDHTPPRPPGVRDVAEWKRLKGQSSEELLRLLGVRSRRSAGAIDSEGVMSEPVQVKRVVTEDVSSAFAFDAKIVRFAGADDSVSGYWIEPLGEAPTEGAGSRAEAASSRAEAASPYSQVMATFEMPEDGRRFGELPANLELPGVVVYLPPGRSSVDGINSGEWERWSRHGWLVCVPDLCHDHDNGILIGEPTTGENLLRVNAAVSVISQLLGNAQTKPFILCYDASGDTGLWATAFDGRIDMLISNQIEAAPRPKQGYRRTGTLPYIAAAASRQLVLGLVAPRPLVLTGDASQPAKNMSTPWWLESGHPDPFRWLESLYALYGR